MSTISNLISTKTTETFKIGAVSHITNIPVDTLRIWERRYSVVTPLRSEKADRLYKREDINRLTLLKLLVDRGNAIGTIAKLNNDELIERLEFINKDKQRVSSIDSGKKSKVVVIGDVLSLQLEYDMTGDSSFVFNGIYSSEKDFRDKINAVDWEIYKNKKVLIKGCSSAPVPTWAYLIITAQLSQKAKLILYGEPCSAFEIYKSNQ